MGLYSSINIRIYNQQANQACDKRSETMNQDDWNTLESIHDERKKLLNDEQVKICSFLSTVVEESLVPLFESVETVKLINPSFKRVLIKSSIMTILLNETKDIDEACALLNEVRKEIEKTDTLLNKAGDVYVK